MSTVIMGAGKTVEKGQREHARPTNIELTNLEGSHLIKRRVDHSTCLQAHGPKYSNIRCILHTNVVALQVTIRTSPTNSCQITESNNFVLSRLRISA